MDATFLEAKRWMLAVHAILAVVLGYMLSRLLRQLKRKDDTIRRVRDFETISRRERLHYRQPRWSIWD